MFQISFESNKLWIDACLEEKSLRFSRHNFITYYPIVEILSLLLNLPEIYKFPADCGSERILKISQYLMKIL